MILCRSLVSKLDTTHGSEQPNRVCQGFRIVGLQRLCKSSYALRYGELFAKQSSFPSVHSILQATAEVEISRTANDCYDV